MRTGTITVIVILLLTPISASGQVIRGTVTDANTGAPVKAADITLLGSDGQRLYRMLTDESGKFDLIIPQGKTVRVRAELIGYQAATSDLLSVKSGEQLEIKMRLSVIAIPLNAVNVVARKPVDWRLRLFYDRAMTYGRSGIGHFWTRADLEEHPPVLVTHLLRTVPSRPAVLCSGTKVFIDNVVAYDPDPNQASPLDDIKDIDLLVSPEDLEGVEMYRDTEIPPDWIPRAQLRDGTTPCMLILLWRKPYAELYHRTPSSPVRWWHVLATLGVAGAIVVANRVTW